MGLKSRERILMAMNHEETDRVPIDLGLHAQLESIRMRTTS